MQKENKVGDDDRLKKTKHQTSFEKGGFGFDQPSQQSKTKKVNHFTVKRPCCIVFAWKMCKHNAEK